MEFIANYGGSSDDEEVVTPRKHKSYTVEFKLKVLKHAKEVSNKAAAEKFGVHRKRVQDWVKQEMLLHKIKSHRQQENSRRSYQEEGVCSHSRISIFNWQPGLESADQKKLRVSNSILQQQAVKMFNAEEDEEGFKGSRGWVVKFLARHNFSLRVPTTVCQKPPSDYVEKIINFLLYIAEVRQKHKYQGIFAADETAVYLDSSGGKCIDDRGAKEVSVLTTGHDKARITVMLTARSDGKKLKPFVLLPRKRMDKEAKALVEKYKHKLELCWKGTVWMNDELTSDYLDRIFGRSVFGKRLLVWDSFRCHLSEATKKKLREIELHTAVVPGGCTKWIQAPDVSWNGPFKAHIRSNYDRWMMNDAQKEFTSSGNPKAPAMYVYLEWIVDAWNSLSAEAIAKSFKDCGITISHDGSEDDHIHCFKEHGPIPEGQFELMLARSAIQQAAGLAEEVDKEQDDENGYLSDESLQFEYDFNC